MQIAVVGEKELGMMMMMIEIGGTKPGRVIRFEDLCNCLPQELIRAVGRLCLHHGQHGQRGAGWPWFAC
jgi:hypothetical protein